MRQGRAALDASGEGQLRVEPRPDDAGAPGSLREPLREAWYRMRSAADLRPGRTVAVGLLGEQIVVGRTRTGALFALRDRCPHRGAPFSRGAFDGETLTCPFHGWRFGPDGRCRAMPALSAEDDADPTTVSVATFPAQEVDGQIWLYAGRNPAGAPPVPTIPAEDGCRAGLAVSVEVEASFDMCVLSLVDPAHVTYVHNSWWWRPSQTAREKVKRFAPLPFGFTMSAHQASVNSRGYRLLGGTPEIEIEFQLPGVRLERIRVGRHRVYNVTYATPVDQNRTTLTNVLYWNVPWLDLVRPGVRLLARAFLNQDKDILELAQKGLDRKPTMVVMGQSDLLGQWYFQLKRAYLAARQTGGPFRNPVEGETILRWRT